MKLLLILRHAKSSWKDAGMADHDRTLNERGKRDAVRVGEVLRDQAIVPDGIACSTAKRARKTVEAAAEASGFNGPILFDPQLYMADPRTLLEQLAQLPDAWQRAMVVGHNPGLEGLVAVLCGAEEEMPTAALAHVELNIQHWSELTSRSVAGRLLSVWRP